MTGIAMALAGVGGAGVVTPLPGGTALNATVSPTNAAAAWSFESNGEVIREQGASALVHHKWARTVRSGAGTGLWIRATLTGGVAPTSGPLGLWGPLIGDHLWQLVNSDDVPGAGSSNKTSTLLIEIATDSSGTNIISSGVYAITANVSGSA